MRTKAGPRPRRPARWAAGAMRRSRSPDASSPPRTCGAARECCAGGAVRADNPAWVWRRSGSASRRPTGSGCRDESVAARAPGRRERQPRAVRRRVIYSRSRRSRRFAVSNQLQHRVHIGPAGWDYPDWDGIFYPPRRPRGFDALRYVASYFTLVEINSTFYRVPAPHVARRWAERVADRPDFTFTLKAHQSLTHHGADGTPAELAPLHKAIEPLADAGRLGAVLLQFPWSFRFDAESRAHLDARVRDLHPLPLAVEVRHGSWTTPGASEYLAALDVAV